MRIIEKVEPEVEIQCPDCKSKLGVNKSDINHHIYTSYGDTVGDSVYTTTCAVCDSRITINEKNIPQGWRPQIKSKR